MNREFTGAKVLETAYYRDVSPAFLERLANSQIAGRDCPGEECPRDRFDVQPGPLWVGMGLEQLARPDDAIREFEATISFGGHATIYLAALGHAYAVAGRRDRALAVLHDLQTRATSRYISALDIATVYMGLGDTEATFEWLERAFQTRASALIYLAVDPRYDPVREDPRFRDLLRRIGLPQPAVPAKPKS